MEPFEEPLRSAKKSIQKWSFHCVGDLLPRPNFILYKISKYSVFGKVDEKFSRSYTPLLCNSLNNRCLIHSPRCWMRYLEDLLILMDIMKIKVS